jgi:hypothetical protein
MLSSIMDIPASVPASIFVISKAFSLALSSAERFNCWNSAPYCLSIMGPSMAFCWVFIASFIFGSLNIFAMPASGLIVFVLAAASACCNCSACFVFSAANLEVSASDSCKAFEDRLALAICPAASAVACN